jgi:hypothetical protein
MSWGKGLEEEDTFCYTTDSQVVGQKPIVERVNFQAFPTKEKRALFTKLVLD